MTTQGNYPMGAEYDTTAPWNEKIEDKHSVVVDVDIILSKRISIKLEDGERMEDVVKKSGEELAKQLNCKYEDWEF